LLYTDLRGHFGMFFLFKLQYDREYGQELGTSKKKKRV
jgi:hypothetical protein